MKQTTSCVLSKSERESTQTSGIEVFTSGHFTLLYSGCVSVSVRRKFKDIKAVHEWWWTWDRSEGRLTARGKISETRPSYRVETSLFLSLSVLSLFLSLSHFSVSFFLYISLILPRPVFLLLLHALSLSLSLTLSLSCLSCLLPSHTNTIHSFRPIPK